MLRSVNKSIAGHYINVPIPDVEQVHISDISHRLSNICRFNGATYCFFPVAQHSLEVSLLCEQYAKDFNVDPVEASMAGLMHDAPEYTYGDIISPVKNLIGPTYKQVTVPADAAVFQALNLVYIMERCKEIVHWADFEMLVSDAARWKIFGNIINNVGKEVWIEEHNKVPEPHVLRFPNARPYAPGESKPFFIQRYHNLKLQLGI